jgi:hypothetical protein
MNCQISGISRCNIPIIWDSVSLLIDRCLEQTYGEYSLSDVLEFLLAGKMQLWVIADKDGLKGITVTELKVYPQRTFCTLLFVAGEDLLRWKDLVSVIEEWALAQGAAGVVSSNDGRWQKVAKKMGYEPMYHTYCKMLRCSHESMH